MAQVTLPYTLTPGTPENVNNLMSNLTALRDGVNTIDTAQLATSSVTAAKLGTSAVETAKISDGAVTSTKLAQTAKGLVYITSATASNASTVTVDNCFTSDFTNYRVIVSDLTTTSGGGNNFFTFTPRANGSNNTSAVTRSAYQFYSLSNGAQTANNLNATYPAGFPYAGSIGSSKKLGNVFDVLAPQKAQRTILQFGGFTREDLSYLHTPSAAIWTHDTQYDGFALIFDVSGTSGTVRVYGYTE